MRKQSQPESALGSEVENQPLSRHPFVVPVITFLVLFLITAVGFVLMGSETIGPNDKRVVQLYVDGQARTVPTRATTVKELLDRLEIKTTNQDIVEPALDSLIDTDNFTVNVYKAKNFILVDKENKREIAVTSAHQIPKDIAKSAGLKVYPEDNVTVAPPDDVASEGINERIVIDRATLTYINLYGNKIAVRTHAATIRELLTEKGVILNSADQLSPSLDAKVVENSQVFIVRTGQKVETRTEKIAIPVEVINDPTLAIGTTKVREKGRPGKRLVTYELQLKNGKVVKRKALQKVIAEKPEPRIELRGTKVPTVAIGGNKAQILSAAGVPASQHFAADFIIAHESGWRLNARNAGGCLGLGQACPGSKLTAVCPNYATDAICQIKFFTGYANGRYGSWSEAYQAWQVQGWW